MNPLYQTFWIAHIVGGALGLLTFWLPVVFRKGSPKHKKTGTWFVWGMSAAGLTGLAMTLWWLADPMVRIRTPIADPAVLERAYLQVRLAGGFLGLLSLMLLANLRHGVLVLRAKAERSALRAPVHVLLLGLVSVAGAAGIITGLRHEHVLLQVFGGIGLFNGLSALRYAYKAELSSREWWIEHLSMLFTCGIAAHTAFFVFGGARFVGQIFSGGWMLLPWLLPSVVGVSAILLVSRHYRRKFNPATVAPLTPARIPAKS